MALSRQIVGHTGPTTVYSGEAEGYSYREIWADMGRYGEIWGVPGRSVTSYRQIWADMGRYGQIWADMGRYVEYQDGV